MAMPAVPYFSAAMVRALPDDGSRYETVYGELLVTPAPRMSHQRVVQDLFLLLADYLRPSGLRGGLFLSPADISWSDDTLVQPDLFVAASDQVRGEWAGIRTLHLAVEVLSPSSVRADRFTKRVLYQQQGVAACWVVDIEQALIEVWTPGALFPVTERERVRWRHPEADTECVIEIAALLRGG